MIDRSERFLHGETRFVQDIELPDTLYLEVLRGPVAHAKITSVNGGISAKDLGLKLISVGESYRRGSGYQSEPVFATEKILYYGEPVAAVYDKDRYRARDMLESIDVKYEELDPVVTIEDALSKPPIHEGHTDNIVGRFVIGERFDKKGEVTVEDELSMERIVPNPLETRGIVAWYNSGKLNVFISTQSVYSIRRGLAGALKLDERDIIVHQVDTGGAFGSKSAVYPEYVIASYISMKERKPVKWIESRQEHLAATRPGRGAKANLRLYANNDGRVIGVEGKVYVNVGAFADDLSSTAPSWISSQITGPYAIENAYIEGLSVYTNTAPQGPYRGAGRPEAAFFIERLMDRLADAIGMDPAEVRLKNLPSGAFRSPTGLEVNGSREFFEKGLNEIGYWRMKKEGRKIGVSFGILIPAVYGGESAKITLKDGKASVWLGGAPHWQRQELFVKHILKDVLGIDQEKVELLNSDTAELNVGIGTWGSRSAIVAGKAVYMAALKLKEDAERMGIRDTASLLNSGLSAEYYEPENLDPSFISFILTAAEAELINGIEPRISRCWAYYDVGEPLSQEAVHGQISGGLVMGIAEVLTEALEYDKKGIPVARTLSEAGVAYINQVPEMHITFVSYGRSRAPHGAKGVGEAGTVGAPPAAARAIELITGKRISRLPLDRATLI